MNFSLKNFGSKSRGTVENALYLLNPSFRMDDLFDSKQGYLYHKIRDSMFPQDSKGSSRYSFVCSTAVLKFPYFRFWNRAGDKLMQVHQKVDLFEGITNGTTFLDMCGGPGIFSLAFLQFTLIQ
jgi:hypothetical protein